MRCDGFTGQMRAFCERHAPQGVAEAFHGYQSLRSRCEWARQPALLRERGVSSSRWQTTAMHERAIVSDTPERSELEDLLPSQTLWTCKVFLADDEYWQFYRLGLFHTTGGYDWVEVNIDDLFDELGETHVHVGAAFMGPVDEAGDPVEHPPLHVHHMHITESFQSYTEKYSAHGEESLYFQTSHADDFTFHIHGDSACMKANRGTECYLLGMPAGHGFRFPAGRQIFFNAEVNDVRQAGSPVLNWSVEVGMHVMRNRSATSVSKLFACTFIGNAPGLTANSAELRQGLSSLPEEDTLVWASFPMHVAGRFLHFGQGISHAHQGYSKGYWILAGSVAEAGFHEPPFTDTRMFEQFLLREHGLTHAMVKAHIRRHLDAARASRAFSGLAPRVLCEAGEGLEYVASSDSGIIGGYYDRMPPLSCANDSDVHFARHDAITMVYFLGPVHPEAPPMQLPYRMHACIGAYLVDDGSAHGDVSEYMANFRYQSVGHEPEFVFNYYVLNFILNSPADNLRRVLLVITSTTPVVSSGIVIVLLLCTSLLCCCFWKLMCCSVRCFRKSTTAKKKTLL